MTKITFSVGTGAHSGAPGPRAAHLPGKGHVERRARRGQGSGACVSVTVWANPQPERAFTQKASPQRFGCGLFLCT